MTNPEHDAEESSRGDGRETTSLTDQLFAELKEAANQGLEDRGTPRQKVE